MAPSTVTLQVRLEPAELVARMEAAAQEIGARGGPAWAGYGDAEWLVREMLAESRSPDGVRTERYGDETVLVLGPRLLALADALEALLEDES